MAHTVKELITDAYYRSGIVAREFQTVDGTQFNDGLKALNEILANITVFNGVIPYYKLYTFVTQINTESYFIPYLIEPSTVTFTISSVRYQTIEVKRNQYFGSTRALNTPSLPLSWHAERCYQPDPNTNIPTEGSNLYFYFPPTGNYLIEVWGTFGLTDVTINQDLSLIYARFYINYLYYKLSVELLRKFGYSVTQDLLNDLNELEGAINNQSQDIDLTVQKISTLQKGYGLNYGFINIGPWTT